MFNKTFFGIGFIILVAEIFVITIVTIVSFFEPAIDLILPLPFRSLIAGLFLDCTIFSLLFRF